MPGHAGSFPGMSIHRCVLLGRIALIPAVFVMSALPGVAATNNNKVYRPFAKKGKAAELPVIKKVTASSITVGDRIYKVSESTVIIVNGEKASLNKLKVGMQVAISGSPKEFGKTTDDTVFKATRIVARADNKLAAKAAEDNRKAAEQARKATWNARNRNR